MRVGQEIEPGVRQVPNEFGQLDDTREIDRETFESKGFGLVFKDIHHRPGKSSTMVFCRYPSPGHEVLSGQAELDENLRLKGQTVRAKRTGYIYPKEHH